ncbi:MAG: lysophospholipid acyltransferase family protein [Methylocystaceae bacterium]
MYRFLRGVGRAIYFFRHWQVTGKENLPSSGGLVVAANHNSAWDPILLGCALNREIYYMGKEELFRRPMGNWFFTQLHAFPVKRGTIDRRAIRKAIDILNSGQVLGIFPEGTRVEAGQTAEPQSGVALLALKARVPVVPVGLRGSRAGDRPRAVIGKPICLNDYFEVKMNSALLETISKQIMMEIDRLLQELPT